MNYKVLGIAAAALTAVLIAGLVIGYVEAEYEASHVMLAHAALTRVKPLPEGGVSVTLAATLRNSGDSDVVLLNPTYSLYVGGAEVSSLKLQHALSLKAGSNLSLRIPITVVDGGPAAKLEAVLGGSPGASLTLTAQIPVKLFGVIPLHPLTVQASING